MVLKSLQIVIKNINPVTNTCTMNIVWNKYTVYYLMVSKHLWAIIALSRTFEIVIVYSRIVCVCNVQSVEIDREYLLMYKMYRWLEVHFNDVISMWSSLDTDALLVQDIVVRYIFRGKTSKFLHLSTRNLYIIFGLAWNVHVHSWFITDFCNRTV